MGKRCLYLSSLSVTLKPRPLAILKLSRGYPTNSIHENVHSNARERGRIRCEVWDAQIPRYPIPPLSSQHICSSPLAVPLLLQVQIEVFKVLDARAANDFYKGHSFVNRTSGGSPKISDCKRMATSIAGGDIWYIQAQIYPTTVLQALAKTEYDLTWHA
jgi:hypothetical protein